MLVLATFWTGVSHALSLVNYFVMPRSSATSSRRRRSRPTLGPSTSGDPWFTYPGQLWSLVLAPVYGLFAATDGVRRRPRARGGGDRQRGDPRLPARRSRLDRPLGRLLAAALTVTVPWLAFAGSVLAESLGYPLFVWALLACSIAIERPSPGATRSRWPPSRSHSSRVLSSGRSHRRSSPPSSCTS